MEVWVRAFTRAADGRNLLILLYLLAFFYVGLKKVSVLSRNPLTMIENNASSVGFAITHKLHYGIPWCIDWCSLVVGDVDPVMKLRFSIQGILAPSKPRAYPSLGGPYGGNGGDEAFNFAPKEG